MLKKVRIIYEAETDLLPGSEVSIRDFYEANEGQLKKENDQRLAKQFIRI